MAENQRPPRTFNPLLRIIASAYILYLAFGMIQGFAEVPANQKLFIGISIVVFIVAPCWFLYTAYRDWKTIKAEEAATAAEAVALAEASEDEAGEEAESEDLDGEARALSEGDSVADGSADDTADKTHL